MNIYEKLAAVQQELKAPKDKKNTFGGYMYRSAEGILEAVKPVLKKYKAAVLLSDEITATGGRIYVKATAEFLDNESINDSVHVTAYAREPEEKKGMDVSQITGTASSYARKYALNGLLLIDDTKDPDTDEYKQQSMSKSEQIQQLAKEANIDLKTILTKPLDALTDKQADQLIESLKKRIGG